MARKYGSVDPKQKRDAFKEVEDIINSFGFNDKDLKEAEKELSKYMPREVFLDKYGDEDGWAMLYALYAPRILTDFFKSEKRSGERRQSPSHRRKQYLELGGDPIDYVQSVFMGYYGEEDARTGEIGQVRGGIRSIADPNPDNKYVYDPRQDGSRPGVCPHCRVSFWSMSAGNGDPKYQMINGKPLPDWRDDPLQAPEHIRFNPQTGERQEDSGYSYCGGRHEIFDVTNAEGGIDVEAAERISGEDWDTLRSQNRVRVVKQDEGLKYFLVDELLNDVEGKLGGDAAYKKFSAEWVYEDGGHLYRECRHPITLRSPSSVIYDRIARYTYNVSDKATAYRAHTIKVYMCPDCPGEFKDINDITTGKGGQEKVTIVQCDECGNWFDITDLPEEMKYSMKYVDPQTSLNISVGEEGRISELIDTVESKDIGQLEVEMSEIFDVFHEEIDKIAKSLNIRGAEYAREVFEDWVITGLDLKEITEKYFTGIYKLHFTECLDCGARTGVDTDDEKSNPDASAKARYDQGLPVTMTQCPRRNSDPRHQVELDAPETPAQEQQVEQVDAWDGWDETKPEPAAPSDIFAPGEQRPTLEQERPQEAIQRDQVQEMANQLDDDQRRRYYGLNLVYHGRAPKGSKQPGVSYLVVDKDSSQPLPSNDPRAYKGGEGIITRHIYAPAQRLIQAILEALQNNPRIRDKHEEALDGLNELAEKSWKEATRIARVRSFCKVS